MINKYFKPKSLSWWSGIAMVLSGAFMAFTPMHAMDELSEAIRMLYAGVSPAVLINSGLAIIGLRGAQG